jgi:hypothetical protein
MKVTMLLADSAQAVGGKLYILGGGWSVTGPDPASFALAVKIEGPWDQADLSHTFKLSLFDSDGHVVVKETPDGAHPVEIDAGFEVERAPGLRPGSPIDVPLAFTFAPIPLEAGERYVWRLEIDGMSEEDWRVAFSTRPSHPFRDDESAA